LCVHAVILIQQCVYYKIFRVTTIRYHSAMTAALAVFAADLVSRFRRQRPLRGGSLIVTIFGDSILPRGGAITLGSLIRLADPFGLNERLVRTAATRLAHDGWVVAQRDGRLSEYRLSPGGRERFVEATRRIYGPGSGPWSGKWTLIVLPPREAAARRQLRKELSWHGFGELQSGVFAHPAVDAAGLAARAWQTPLPKNALIFEADLTSQSASALIERGWDLKDLALRYQRFVQRFERAATLLQREPDTASAFLVRTLLIHEYRRFHLRDPLLPEQLLPADWPGTRAAQLCRDIYRRVFEPSEVYLSAVAENLKGKLPPPGSDIRERFGGL
jgi:phenylacetic acid degradation operon negative regulatory protein